MIVVFYLEDMSDNPMGQFFDSMESFARTKFKIEISDDGYVAIDGKETSVSYKLGDNPKTEYTKEEVFKDFIKGSFFKVWAKSRFWTVYKTEKII